jgi:hypothetical protein
MSIRIPNAKMIVLLAFSLLAVWPAALDAAEISAGSATTSSGRTALLPIQFQSTDNGVALQFDLAFDTNRIASGSAVSANPTTGYFVSSSEPRAGLRRIVIYSLGAKPLESGALVNVPFMANANAPESDVEVRLQNAILSKADGVTVQPITLTSGKVTISASAAARFSSVRITSDGRILLEGVGAPDRSYILQGSSDLLQWVNLKTNSPVAGVLSFEDSLNQPRRFYRALLR